MMKSFRNVINNTLILYSMNIAKLVFPLLTLPYLTRVLSVESYAAVAYIKSIMSYMQILIDFGFLLSGTRDIVKVQDDKKILEKVNTEILMARIMLAVLALLILFAMMCFIPILRSHSFYTLLSFLSVFLSIFLFDYLFRGIEKMHIIALRFVAMRGITTFFTFFLVKGDEDIFLIPLLDFIGSLIAVLFVLMELKKMKISFELPSLKNAFNKLKESAVFFASNMATTTFGALNTVLIGMFLQEADVAYWSVSMQLIGAVQTMYSPITDGVYPEMIKNRCIHLIKKILLIFMPIIAGGCAFSFLTARYILLIVGGSQYEAAVIVFRYLIPVLLLSFPSMVLGWPTLGAINKEKQVTITTISAAIFQVLGLFLLIILGEFNLVSIAILRCLTELVLMVTRSLLCIRFKDEFKK